MNLAFHLAALLFLLGLAWAWIKERQKLKLLTELRHQAVLFKAQLGPQRVYVHIPITFIEQILGALNIPIDWRGSTKSPPKHTPYYKTPQKLNPLPFFLLLVNHPVIGVSCTEWIAPDGENKIVCIFLLQNSQDLSKTHLLPLEGTFGPGILFHIGDNKLSDI